MSKSWLRLLLLLAVGWVWLPFIPFSVLGTANQALLYAIPAVSLVLLTGWVGQISLAQAAFVGIGGFGTAFLARKGLTIPFPFGIPVMGILGAGAAMLLGVVALRVRGLYLAVATLIFAWMADSYFFGSPWFAGTGGSATVEVTPVGAEGTLPRFDFNDRRVFYLVALAGVALSMVALLNLRQSKTGRAFFAIRGSEMAAASLGIDVTRYKLLAFAIAGFIAGMAGNIIITGQGTIVPAQFNVRISLLYLAVAVVGGLQSLGGTIASGTLFALLGELFYRVPALGGWLEVVSAAMLAGVLLFYPGGLAAMPGTVRAAAGRLRAAASTRRVRRLAGVVRSALAPIVALVGGAFRLAVRGRRRIRASLAAAIRLGLGRRRRGVGGIAQRPGQKAPGVPDVLADFDLGSNGRVGGHPGQAEPLEAKEEAATNGAAKDIFDPSNIPHFRLARNRLDRKFILGAEGVTVRFGGLTAVDDASLQVREGEIVGLIGPNGAGKTTLFNAVAGFNTPQSGRITLWERDISKLAVHRRAELGIGRTFQLIQLFPQLSVFESLLVATHIRNDTGFVSHLVVTARAGQKEAAAIERVRKVIALLGLEEVADRKVGGLPFGTLRMVELGRALVTGSPLVMLDEPASGLDTSETERFANILRFLRATLGISILLIEHDVSLVMAVCDYVYVIDRGKLISEGTPDEVRADTAVVAAYLGSPSQAKEPASSAAKATDAGKPPAGDGRKPPAEGGGKPAEKTPAGRSRA